MDWEKELGTLLGQNGLAAAGLDKSGNDLRNKMVDNQVIAAMGLIERCEAPSNYRSSMTEHEVRMVVNELYRGGGNLSESGIRHYVSRVLGHADKASGDAVISGLRQSGVPLTEANLGEANPFHAASDGKFTTPTGIVSAGRGSKSFQFSGGPLPDRSRGGRIGKDRSGRTRALIKWVAAQRPCGRAARKQGLDRLCWSDANKKSKTRKESDDTMTALNRLLG